MIFSQSYLSFHASEQAASYPYSVTVIHQGAASSMFQSQDTVKLLASIADLASEADCIPLRSDRISRAITSSESPSAENCASRAYRWLE